LKISEIRTTIFIFVFLEFWAFFVRVMSGCVLHRRRSPEDLEQLRAWYRIRVMLLGRTEHQEALELASVCEHPNAVWLTELFAGRDVASYEEMRQVFLSFENDPRALCFAACLCGPVDEIRRAADLGDGFAQAEMARDTGSEEGFGGHKNLLLRENAMFFSWLDIAFDMELNAMKTWKERERIFWLPLSLDMCARWVLWASYLTRTILNELFGLEELHQMEDLPTS
jgi:hypothetical protein